MLRKLRILVTGGAGFIGSHYVRRPIGGAYPAFAGASAVTLDKLTYAGDEANLAPVSDDERFELVVGDICDAGR
jgi:dTDP-glucose 4,6-dehydratase